MKECISLLLAVLFVAMAAPFAANAQPDSANDHRKGLNNARLVGWQLSESLIRIIERDDHREFPGNRAWLAEWNQLAAKIGENGRTDEWPPFDVDALVTHNPEYWRAHYEIAPSDPALPVIHAGLLMAAGELTRASHVIVIARQCPGTPEEYREIYPQILATCAHGGQTSNDLVAEGIKAFDAGNYDAAMQKYQEALKIWPQNSWAYYERGYTLQILEYVKAGKALPKPGTAIVNPKITTPPEAMAAFAESRRHDPFQGAAYQGNDQAVINAMLVLGRNAMPVWKRLAAEDPPPATDDDLDQLATACQEAGVHELALVIRQLIVAKRGKYHPSDFPFITKSLEALVGEENAALTLARLAGEHVHLRQLVRAVRTPATQEADE